MVRILLVALMLLSASVYSKENIRADLVSATSCVAYYDFNIQLIIAQNKFDEQMVADTTFLVGRTVELAMATILLQKKYPSLDFEYSDTYYHVYAIFESRSLPVDNFVAFGALCDQILEDLKPRVSIDPEKVRKMTKKYLKQIIPPTV